ncbi:archaemetzincin-2-like [Porites lutea]|uniref:archaemetzincin-2-like n=1 Tax=Porites lutea TaxID=51062 RepID=UPI003CC6C609
MATASQSSSSSSSSFITTTVRDLGNLQQLSKKEKAFLTEGIKDKKLFPPLPTPDEDAWLSSHTETQQSHAAWSRKFQSVVTAASQNNKICLVPLGDEWTESEVDVDKSSNKESFLSLLQRFAAAFFTGYQVVVLPSVSINKLKCKTRRHCGHLQLFIPDVYKYLQSKWPRGAFCVVGITMIDLYPNESWNFVFGQANPGAGVGVFSFARYDPLFYEPRSVANKSPCTSTLVLWRSCKVMTHEISHLFCLKHCVYFSCAMNGSNHLEESNRRPMFTCPVCLNKLKSCLGFDIKKRYQALLEFCQSVQDENFAEACVWLENAVEKLS